MHVLTLKRSVTAAALSLATVAGITAAATDAQAYDKSTTTISCNAAKVRAQPSKNATVKGIAYKKDKILFDQFAYKQSEKTWYTRGKVTRKSDGAKIYGYVAYMCANPYETNPAPTPKIPK
ncbi:hypothetical protein [Streptomyces afghaniensis]|uniref:hypothetical protein n=1 Tax=Streptomyces afghaniensis TaxID=66865 RepID=UPI0037AAAA68